MKSLNFLYIVPVACGIATEDHSVIASSPKREPLVCDKSTYPLLIVKNVSIPYPVWQRSKYKPKTHPYSSCTMSLLHWLHTKHLMPCWISVVAGNVLHTLKIKARGCKPTRMRSYFMMGRQQSPAASRCTLEVDAVLFIKLQKLGKHCQSSLFILMNTVLKQMAIKQEVCLFVE